MFDNALFDGEAPPAAPTPPPDSGGYLGRFQRGQVITIGIVAVATPDAVPTAQVKDGLGNVLAAFALPMAGDTTAFSLPVRLWGGIPVGRFTVAYAYDLGGVPHTATDTFDVVPGGDSGGEVISLCCYDRPEARYVVAQLGGGRLVRGRNPHL